MKASIDIGSNSTLLLGGSYTEKGFDIVLNEARVTGLGKDLDKTGEFKQESMDATFSALTEYKKLITEKNISLDKITLTATEASRVAKNAPAFYQKVKEELGFSVQIISGAGEAYYTALGVALGSKTIENEVIIMDIGGASTEFIKVQLNPFNIISSISTPIGSVRATDWSNSNTFDEKFNKILHDFSLEAYTGYDLECVAGTMTSLGAMNLNLAHYDDKKVQGHVIEATAFSNFYQSICTLSGEELLEKFPFLGKRAASINGGARVAYEYGKSLNVKNYKISTFGLRYGTLSVEDIDEKFLTS